MGASSSSSNNQQQQQQQPQQQYDQNGQPVQKPAPQTCFEYLWHWRHQFMWCSAGSMIVGVVLIIVFIIQLVAAIKDPSNVLKEYNKWLDQYNSAEAPDIRLTTVSNPANMSFVTALIPWTLYNGSLANSATFAWVDLFWTGRIARPTTGTSTSISLTMTLVTSITGTSQTFTNTFSSASIPLTSTWLSTARPLDTCCIAVRRKYRNGEWFMDPDRASCYYPFDTKSNQYSATADPNFINVIVRSSYSPWTLVQHYSRGTMIAENKELLVGVDFSLLQGGAILLGCGIIFMSYLCCCLREPAPRTHPAIVAGTEMGQMGYPAAQPVEGDPYAKQQPYYGQPVQGV